MTDYGELLDGCIETCLADVQAERVAWLWKGRIPLGKLTVLEGAPDTMKTTLALDVAGCVTTDGTMPDGAQGCTEANVVFLTAEDGLADTIKPRLVEAGAETSRVFTLETRKDDAVIGLTFPEDVSVLAAFVTMKDAKLVVIDPLNAFLADATDTYKDHSIRRALAPLARLAEETGAAVLVIRHWTKNERVGALYRGGGSIGIAAAARSVLVCACDPDHEGCFVLAGVKSNLAAPPSSLAYHPEVTDGAVHIVWDGVSPHTADVLAQPAAPEDQSALRDAKDFLAEYLAMGPVPAKEVFRNGKADGHAETTLKRAKKDLGVEKQREGFGSDGRWLWRLPSPKAAIGGHTHARPPMEPEDSVSDCGETTSYTGPRIEGREGVARYIELVRTYVEGHPEPSREAIVGFLGLSVSLADGKAAIDVLVASGDPLFSHLTQETPDDAGVATAADPAGRITPTGGRNWRPRRRDPHATPPHRECGAPRPWSAAHARAGGGTHRWCVAGMGTALCAV